MATLALLKPLPTAAAPYGPRIHDMPQDERPRERLLRHGAAALSNAELIAILLRTGVAGENVLSMSQRLLTNRRGLRGIATASLGELSGEKGISEAKYCQLIAGFELGRRLASLGVGDRVTVQGPQDIANLLQAEMALLAQEHLRVVLLSTKNQVLGVHLVYVGTVNTSLVRAAEVFRPAVRENAPNVIVVHNHPSGDPTPSAQDIDLTQQLRSAAHLLQIDLLDHIVIGHDRVVSMSEQHLGFP